MRSLDVIARRFAVLVAAVGAVALQGCDSAVTYVGSGPPPEPDTSSAIKLVVAGAHTCALTIAGKAYCWGLNEQGQLGNSGSARFNPTPIPVSGGLTFRSIAVSNVGVATCALTTVGAAYCWGDNLAGQLGDGTITRRLTPTRVATGLAFVSISVGAYHACALTSGGSAYCWGSTLTGALGDGTTASRIAPVRALTGLTFRSITTGVDFTCGLTPAGAAYCWGAGFDGQLGNGAKLNSATPVLVSGAHVFSSISAGTSTVCGVTAAGKAYCWGNNFFGTVGDGTRSSQDPATWPTTPVEVGGGLTFKSIAGGTETMCGVTTAGAGYCWGNNLGALGDGTFETRTSPSRITGGLAFQSVSGGHTYSCGLTIQNAVYCWGDNRDGQLGDGTASASVVPVQVRWP